MTDSTISHLPRPRGYISLNNRRFRDRFTIRQMWLYALAMRNACLDADEALEHDDGDDRSVWHRRFTDAMDRRDQAINDIIRLFDEIAPEPIDEPDRFVHDFHLGERVISHDGRRRAFVIQTSTFTYPDGSRIVVLVDGEERGTNADYWRKETAKERQQ
jgi:hypothetical protein